jgi:sodium/hydrogen exchanger-like protein 6/7
VKKKKFFRNFASIATLGILGTYILFAVIALGLFAISKLPNLLNLTVR